MKAYQFDIEQERTRRSMPSTIRYPDRYLAKCTRSTQGVRRR